ncbi:Calx-beta domain-containing protein [Actinomarinicola tropica]|uniref:Calx-beta domain-containing protein n=1 Tax=Actinomarinicola tropica TaxID=2789776 RepID=A0A5Q2RM88_9ACTN|nr:Calx-beta domain-containing protein [Actinomarinicola tropica]QGG95681.1 hypothetical protein GH723_11555 [Actinomarinicola tropica]
MRPTIRSATSLALAALVGVTATAAGAASARPDDVIPVPGATPPTIHISQETHAEGTGGPTGFHFTVSLSHPSDQPVSVDLVTTPGSATSPSDHQSVPATVVFAPGQTTADYVVSVVGDAVPEGDEEFVVEMSNAQGGTIVGGGGLGTILDDDGRGPGGFTTSWASVRHLVQLVLSLPA